MRTHHDWDISDEVLDPFKLFQAARAAVVGFPTRVAESQKVSFLIFGVDLRYPIGKAQSQRTRCSPERSQNVPKGLMDYSGISVWGRAKMQTLWLKAIGDGSAMTIIFIHAWNCSRIVCVCWHGHTCKSSQNTTKSGTALALREALPRRPRCQKLGSRLWLWSMSQGTNWVGVGHP